MADTPINTDQGIIAIDKLIAGVHTIDNQEIVAITNTVSPDDVLISFDKDALGINCPDKRTVMTSHHCIEYEGNMREAESFIRDFENVNYVSYNGETLYNVLMKKHSKMQVNNLTCETLHPEHPVAKKYLN